MKKALKITIFVFLSILLIVGGLFWANDIKKDSQEFVLMAENALSIGKDQKNNENVVVDNEPKVNENIPVKKEVKVLSSCNLNVPFTCQAPYQNWAEPWQDACEEASLMMVDHYLKNDLGNVEMSKDLANQEILDMVDWQIRNWGGHYDLVASQIAKLAKEYYNYKNVEVKYDITVKDIKKELSQGNAVIVPTAGRLLANPNFTAPGPTYHNIVIVGYDENGFITNDPGVWQGFKFRYTFDNLYNAIHDYDSNSMLNGRKAMVVIKGKSQN